VALLLALLTGCAHVPLNARYAGPQPLPQESATYYAYPQRAIEATVTPAGDHVKFRSLFLGRHLNQAFTR